ncbi:YqgE/AlgH family protein [Paraconexibacter sp.]|uniref:YqgE/AlgH family protein n=1 Tax=Paraconexibacter sp. TaxID=2949640 RepID=UPI003568279D
MSAATLKGKILLASPALADPNFVRTVVLLAEHGAEGALGLVLNRPTDALVGEAVDELTSIVDEDDAVYGGGPVGEDAVMVVAEFDDPALAAELIVEDLGFLPADSDLDRIATATRRARVFAGHAGWGPGQLEGELEEGAWIVVDAHRDDVFTEDPDDLWSIVLERKGGPYAVLARMPEDPSVN